MSSKIRGSKIDLTRIFRLDMGATVVYCDVWRKYCCYANIVAMMPNIERKLDFEKLL